MDSIYTPLDRPRNEIRLIRLSAAENPTSTIVCELIHVSLDAEPAYEALSYTWDSGHATDHIELGGKGFWVTKNLHSALHALRRSTKSRDLWVDAVCINQQDVAERSQQVLRMLSIYKKAERVVVWLGEASADSPLAMDHLALLDQQWREAELLYAGQNTTARKLYSWITVVLKAALRLMELVLYGALEEPFAAAVFLAISLYWWMYGLPFGLSLAIIPFLRRYFRGIGRYQMRLTETVAKQEELAKPAAVTIKALKDLFNRRWFRRTWIIQEIAASRDAVVVCGSNELSWRALRTASKEISRLVDSDRGKSPYLESGFQDLDMLSSVLDVENVPEFGTKMKKSLLYLMNAFSHFGATDPRDKVYGLLGLSEEARPTPSYYPMLKPDYGQPVERVFADVVRYLVCTTGQLDILRACLGSKKISGLPSWAPDWTASMSKSVSGLSYHREPFHLPDETDRRVPVAKFSEDLRMMLVRGFIVGRLVGVGKISLDASLSNTADYESQNASMRLLVYILHPFFLILRALFHLWGVGPLLSLLIRRNPAGLGFIFVTIEALRANIIHGPPPTLPRTLEAYLKHSNTAGREKLVMKSFTCEQIECLQWMAKVCSTYADAQAGDLICMLIGAKVPFLIRYEGTKAHLVGPANLGGFLVHILLWNDIVKHHRAGDLDLEEVLLH